MAEWRKPTCKKCGFRHLNFERCEDARIDQPPVVVRAARQDGLTDWGSRAVEGEFARGKEERIDRPRAPIGLGRVTHSDVGEMPQLARPRPVLTYPLSDQES